MWVYLTAGLEIFAWWQWIFKTIPQLCHQQHRCYRWAPCSIKCVLCRQAEKCEHGCAVFVREDSPWNSIPDRAYCCSWCSWCKVCSQNSKQGVCASILWSYGVPYQVTWNLRIVIPSRPTKGLGRGIVWRKLVWIVFVVFCIRIQCLKLPACWYQSFPLGILNMVMLSHKLYILPCCTWTIFFATP